MSTTCRYVPKREELEALDPVSVEEYLLAKGWSEQEHRERTGVRFSFWKHAGREQAPDVLLVKTRTAGDYVSRMADLLFELEALEQRPWRHILHELSGAPGEWALVFGLDAPRRHAGPPVAEWNETMADDLARGEAMELAASDFGDEEPWP